MKKTIAISLLITLISFLGTSTAKSQAIEQNQATEQKIDQSPIQTDVSVESNPPYAIYGTAVPPSQWLY